jgi:hypothetical protein
MTTTEAPSITIPKLEGETPRAYAARVEYLTMGAGRSLDKLRQNHGKTTATYTRQVENWSAKYGWQAAASEYDQTVATLAAQAHAVEYQEHLKAQRDDAMNYGKALCAVAAQMLTQLQKSHKDIDYTPAALATIAKALTTGLDLRAHALDLERIIPTLSEGRDDA